MAIPLKDFDIDLVSFGDAIVDSYGGFRIPIKYQRNGKEGKVVFDLPLVRTSVEGVISSNFQGSGESHSVKLYFPSRKPVFVEDFDEDGQVIGGHYEEPEKIPQPEDPQVEVENTYEDSELACQVIEQIYEKAIDFYIKEKNKFKRKLGDSKKPEAIKPLFKNPIYRRIDEDTGEPDPKVPPSLYAKFIESSGRNADRQVVYTKFLGVDGKDIHWSTLQNTIMYLLPTITVESIYIGQKGSIQVKLQKAFVTWTKPREEYSNDTKKVQELLESNPGLMQAFLNGVNDLSKYREVKRESDAPKKKEIPSTSPESPTKPAGDLEDFMKGQKGAIKVPIRRTSQQFNS